MRTFLMFLALIVGLVGCASPDRRIAASGVDVIEAPREVEVGRPFTIIWQIQEETSGPVPRRKVQLIPEGPVQLEQREVISKSDGTFAIVATVTDRRFWSITANVQRLGRMSLSGNISIPVAVPVIPQTLQDVSEQFSQLQGERFPLMQGRPARYELHLRNAQNEVLTRLPAHQLRLSAACCEMSGSSYQRGVWQFTLNPKQGSGPQRFTWHLSEGGQSKSFSTEHSIQLPLNQVSLRMVEKTQSSSQLVLRWQFVDSLGQLIPREHLPTPTIMGADARLSADGDGWQAGINLPSGRGELSLQIYLESSRIGETHTIRYGAPRWNSQNMAMVPTRENVHPFLAGLPPYFGGGQSDALMVMLKRKDETGQLVETSARDWSGVDFDTTGPEVRLSAVEDSPQGAYLKIIPRTTETGTITLAATEGDRLIGEIKIESTFAFEENSAGSFIDTHSFFSERLNGFEFDMQPQMDPTSPWSDNEQRGVKRLSEFGFARSYPHPLIPHRNACDGDRSPTFNSTREMTFSFENQSRVSTHLYIRDNTSDFDSRNVHSALYFLPRRVLPHVLKHDEGMSFILPTGEAANYNSSERLFKSGVLAEGNIDYGAANPQNCSSNARQNKKFADVSYRGKGVAIRVNFTTGGYMPQHTGSDGGAVIGGKYGETGQRMALAYYYDQTQNKYVKCAPFAKIAIFKGREEMDLKFVTDQEFADFLGRQCGAEFKRRALP